MDIYSSESDSRTEEDSPINPTLDITETTEYLVTECRCGYINTTWADYSPQIYHIIYACLRNTTDGGRKPRNPFRRHPPVMRARTEDWTLDFDVNSQSSSVGSSETVCYFGSVFPAIDQEFLWQLTMGSQMQAREQWRVFGYP